MHTPPRLSLLVVGLVLLAGFIWTGGIAPLAF